MKRLFLLACIFLLLGFQACDKNEEEIEYPFWFQRKIELIASNPATCKHYNIMIARYNGSNYYIIQSDISSCMYCDIYDKSGVKPIWIENIGTEDTWTHFLANMKIMKSQTACK